MRLTAAAVIYDYEYISKERCAPSAPAPADCSRATERRAAHRLRVGCEETFAFQQCHHTTHRFSIVLLLLAVVDYILSLETIPFFELKI